MFQGVNFLSSDPDKKGGRKSTDKSDVFELSKPETREKEQILTEKKDVLNENVDEKDKNLFESQKVKGSGEIELEGKKSWWKKIFEGKKKEGKEQAKMELVDKNKEKIYSKNYTVEDKFKINDRVKVGEKIKPLENPNEDILSHLVSEDDKGVLFSVKNKSRDAFGNKLDKGGVIDFDVNLIPTEKPGVKYSEKIIILAVVIVVSLGCLGLVYGILAKAINDKRENIVITRVQLDDMDQEIEDINSQTNGALAWNKKISTIGELLYKHKWWSKFFRGLEETTSVNVYYESLEVIGDKVSLNGVAKDYESLAKAMLSYVEANDFIKSFTITSIAKVGNSEEEEELEMTDEVAFVLSFIVNDKFLAIDME